VFQEGQLGAELADHGVDDPPDGLAGPADPFGVGDDLVQGKQVAAGRSGARLR
jgi:hypothetical protein